MPIMYTFFSTRSWVVVFRKMRSFRVPCTRMPMWRSLRPRIFLCCDILLVTVVFAYSFADTSLKNVNHFYHTTTNMHLIWIYKYKVQQLTHSSVSTINLLLLLSFFFFFFFFFSDEGSNIFERNKRFTTRRGKSDTSGTCPCIFKFVRCDRSLGFLAYSSVNVLMESSGGVILRFAPAYATMKLLEEGGCVRETTGFVRMYYSCSCTWSRRSTFHVSNFCFWIRFWNSQNWKIKTRRENVQSQKTPLSSCNQEKTCSHEEMQTFSSSSFTFS